MKKIVLMVMVFLMMFTFAQGSTEPEKEPLTPAQIQTLQLSADIFASCVINKTVIFTAVGFTTEWSISKGFELCSQEGQNLIVEMEDAGLSSTEINANFKNLFNGMVVSVDNRRNSDAMKRLEDYAKKKKEETSM